MRDLFGVAVGFSWQNRIFWESTRSRLRLDAATGGFHPVAPVKSAWTTSVMVASLKSAPTKVTPLRYVRVKEWGKLPVATRWSNVMVLMTSGPGLGVFNSLHVIG
ncbi:hypothetical protein [Umezawaea sp. NPDC059074]|uniref:hypothetical protein n=1 Tax=Umezawaea sp. NPDC059074 TaxID=3346716 RepID=UPI0036AD3E84